MAMFTNSRPSYRNIVPCEETAEGISIPELWENETIDYKLNEVEFALTNESPVGKGVLFITSKRIIWLESGSECNKAFDFDVPYITLHAVSRDLNTYPKPCIYCQLDVEEGEEEEADMTEFFLAPSEENDLLAMFEAFSHAAMLNPDPLEDGEDDGGDEFIYNVDEVNLGAEQALALNHWDSVFVEPGEAGEMEEEVGDEQDDCSDENQPGDHV